MKSNSFPARKAEHNIAHKIGFRTKAKKAPGISIMIAHFTRTSLLIEVIDPNNGFGFNTISSNDIRDLGGGGREFQEYYFQQNKNHFLSFFSLPCFQKFNLKFDA